MSAADKPIAPVRDAPALRTPKEWAAKWAHVDPCSLTERIVRGDRAEIRTYLAPKIAAVRAFDWTPRRDVATGFETLESMSCAAVFDLLVALDKIGGAP